jgi:HSP20 family protein
MDNAPWLAADVATFPIRKPASDPRPWLPENEGALSVDVHEEADAIVVRAPIAGVRPGDLDLSIHNDMLTVRGKRTDLPADEKRVTLHQECHWGSFSRSLIMPVPVRADDASAELKDGILTIRLPKATRHGVIPLNTPPV